jgi:hypothetical protein
VCAFIGEIKKKKGCQIPQLPEMEEALAFFLFLFCFFGGL